MLMGIYLYKLKIVLLYLVLFFCQFAGLYSYTGLRNTYREVIPAFSMMAKGPDYNSYLQRADSLNNCNGLLDSYGEACSAAADFIMQNNKHSFRKFAEYLTKLGYSPDFEKILNSIQTDKFYDKTLSVTSPPAPDSIVDLIRLRQEYMKEVQRVDSLVYSFQSELRKKFIRGIDLFSALYEMEKNTRLIQWALENINRGELNGVTDARTFSSPREFKEYSDYRKFNSIDDSLLAETYSFLGECYKIAEFSVMLDAETGRLYYLDSLLDKYGEKFLKYLSDIDYESMIEYDEATPGEGVKESNVSAGKAGMMNNRGNLDIDTIRNINTVNDELLKLYFSLELTNKSIDKLNNGIIEHNRLLEKFRANLESLGKLESRFGKEGNVFAKNCNTFIRKNSGQLNPLMCFDKWSLLRNSFSMKLEAWKLLNECFQHNENILMLKKEEKELQTEKMRLTEEKNKYAERYNKLKTKFRELNLEK